MSKTRWLTTDEERAWRAVRRLLTVVPSRLARDLNQLGLSSADYEVLSTLSEKPGRRWGLRDFAEKMQWSRSRLSHHATRMEARGLIERAADPDDARGSIYHLTDSGFDVLAEAAPKHLDSVRRRFVDHLTPDELAVLERVSTRIADLPE
ncbi:MarR family transcriptional regulator [Kribbella sp. NBC_00709]|uniref:MarR family winged helix-turn-helix transcriptional regulator n=1 Tax=Kribbella sp. NBC_00709 TaxID=2975972 RepID=UPI002E287E42|nr:MarR family transcriptional regulator [Kribbella sp. NBC_00709]